MTVISRRGVIAGTAALGFETIPSAGAAEKAGVTPSAFNANNSPTARNNAAEAYVQQKVAGSAR